MKRISVEEFKNLLSERILIYDGAMGTNLQVQGLTSEDFGGCDGCSEALTLHCPQSVKKVHRDFINVGCQVIETNTFGATRITLKEYGLENRVAEINRKAVEIAREAIDEANPPEQVLIAGSIGPTSMLPSLGNITFDDMADAYSEQFAALWEAGVDIFQIETCQDLLQIKAALYAADDLFKAKGDRCPVIVSVTLESSGTMLVGSDIDAITTVLEPYDFIDALSINCATGPLEMVRHVAHMVSNWPRAVGVMPNAGLPENVDGKPVYKMTPDEFAEFHHKFVTEFGVNIVGGCCGTRPEHLRAVVERISALKPTTRNVRVKPQVASLFSAVSLRQKPAPAMVGERTNANGAKRFKELLEKNDWEGMTAMGREQARGGAHLVDLCVAYVGRNEIEDLQKLVPMFATQVNLPLVIDSTNPAAIEVALKRHGGRCVINSVNLEDGGARLRQIAALAQKFGAALICLTIDEKGMAKSSPEKLEIASRIFEILTNEFGFRASDLIFDPLTFTVGSGDAELRNSAAETLKAIRLINEKFPDSNTILGLSNVSFGLSVASREILNSVFLQEAIQEGLSCAIVNPAKLLPVHSISEADRKLALDLVHNPRGDGSELSAFLNAFAGKSAGATKVNLETLPDEEQLSEKVVDGDASSLDTLTDRLLKKSKPEQIINEILLPAMKRVGELFGAGKLQLPFVLQSAEVVKKTVGILEPLMEKQEPHPDRKMILATVAGDVHDIGKNLVNIMLSNNGYAVYDLGIKIDIDEMIKAALENDSRVIGMSGLLVRSTQIMKENLEELNRREFLPAVILGGAALTPEYVELELKPLYRGQVFYAKDAVDALKIMETINQPDSASSVKAPSSPQVVPQKSLEKKPADEIIGKANRHQFVIPERIVQAPFYENHLLEVQSNDLFSLLSHKVLFEGRWGFKQGSLNPADYEKMLDDKARPALNRFIESDKANEIFQTRAVYGYYRCKSQGNSIRLFDDAGLNIGEFEFPRQSRSPNLCVSDFISDEQDDLIALWAVTIGSKIIEKGKSLFQNDKYCDYHLLHGLGAELADCGAVHVHRHIHRELFPEQPLTDNRARGCRYSFGYPACPDLSAQKELFRLLKAQSIGLELTESSQMVPELSVSGFIIFNDHARYFVP